MPATTTPYPEVKPRVEIRIEPERGPNRNGEWGVVGYVEIAVAHCDRHGTSGDAWRGGETTHFCGPCRDEVSEWGT